MALALEASKSGQGATTALNASNEVAVEAFLKGEIGFVDIAHLNEQVLNAHSHSKPQSLTDILELDTEARHLAKRIVNKEL